LLGHLPHKIEEENPDPSIILGFCLWGILLLGLELRALKLSSLYMLERP